MKIKVLAEDTAISPAFRSEHGLSLYIETKDNKILFDTGASDLFLENAKKLNVNIKDIDLAVISHGHYDHGGGLKAFLKENGSAKVYVNQRAFENHYSKKPKRVSYIGLDKTLADHERIVLTGDVFPISHELSLFSWVTGNDLLSSCNNSLFAEEGDAVVEDEFAHEQNLIITEDDKTVLIAGCAHRGIVNITNSSAYLKNKQPDFIIGGFHLYNYGENISEDPSTVTRIGEVLKGTGSMYYTGHCTGRESFEILKGILGDRIQYISAGSIIEI